MTPSSIPLCRSCTQRFGKQRRPFCELSNVKFIMSKTVERAPLFFKPRLNIAISNERVSLFAVLGAVVPKLPFQFFQRAKSSDRRESGEEKEMQ